MAKLPIDYHPAARLEALDAFDWYQTQSLIAADRFHRELADAQRAIQELPEAWPKYLSNTRHYLLRRYPYIVVYRPMATRIEIVAVAHVRRKPGYWAERLHGQPPRG